MGRNECCRYSPACMTRVIASGRSLPWDQAEALMRRLSTLGWAGALLALCACTAQRATAPDPPALPKEVRAVEAAGTAEAAPDPWRRGQRSAGRFLVACAPAPAPIRLNEPFELALEVRLAAEPERPVVGAQVFVSAWMPDHEHGMVRQPETSDQGGGSYRARGLLFHMPGHWQLRVDVIAGGPPERTVFDVF